MPDNRRIDHPRLILEFVRSATRHWVSYVSGGLLAALLWWLEGVGWVTPRHSIVWIVVALGLLVAAYQAWVDERLRVDDLAERLDAKRADRKRELIRVLTALRSLQAKVLRWRDLANGKWGLVRDAEKLVPDNLSTILYEAGEIKPDLRITMELVASKVTEAESSIAQFMGQPVAFKQEQLMRNTYRLLDEAAPLLSKVVVEIEAFEGSMAR